MDEEIPFLWRGLAQNFLQNHKQYLKTLARHQDNPRLKLRLEPEYVDVGIEGKPLPVLKSISTDKDNAFSIAVKGFSPGTEPTITMLYYQAKSLAEEISKQEVAQLPPFIRVGDIYKHAIIVKHNGSREDIRTGVLHLWAREQQEHFHLIALKALYSDNGKKGGMQRFWLDCFRVPYTQASSIMQDIRKIDLEKAFNQPAKEICNHGFPVWDCNWIDRLRGVPGLHGIVRAYEASLCPDCGKMIRQVSRVV